MKAEQTENKNIEEGIKILLQASYKPINPRPAFKKELLTKLKGAQKNVVKARIHKQKIRYAMFSFASTAAAILVIMFGSLIDTQDFSNSVITQTKQPVLSNGNSKEIMPGVMLTANKYSNIKLEDGALDFTSGSMSLSVSDYALPYEVKIKNHSIKLQPGSQLAININEPAGENLGKLTAPDIRLINGEGVISTLTPNYTYRLHLDNELEDENPDAINDTTWAESPSLVNFTHF